MLFSSSDRAGEIIGQVFGDLDGSQAREAGESGLNGWTVELIDPATGDVLATQTTADLDVDGSGGIDPESETGRYRFTGLAPGRYLVREVLQAAFDATTAVSVEQNVSGGGTAEAAFGNRMRASFQGLVYTDADGNGMFDPPIDTGLAGWTVYVDQNDNQTPDEFSVIASGSGTPASLPDLATVRSTATVSGIAGTVADVNVTLDIEHGLAADLRVTLISPRGTRVLLVDGVGDTGNEFAGTTFDDEAAENITAATAPYSGSYRPEGSLADFDGQFADGVWTLEISDLDEVMSGVLNSWSLSLSVAEPTAVTASDDPGTVGVNEAGHYRMDFLPLGTYRVAQVVAPGYEQTFPAGSQPHTVVLAPGDSLTGIDFGNEPSGPLPGGIPPTTQESKALGDANGDGAIDRRDVAILAWNFGRQFGARWDDGDFTGDGRVTLADLAIVVSRLGESTTSTGSPSPAPPTDATSENETIPDAIRSVRRRRVVGVRGVAMSIVAVDDVLTAESELFLPRSPLRAQRLRRS
jgi:subtilisin-like proprotein convertase family protein